ncbi:MAG: pitrilysin family protein [Hyphomicrobiaceae bacterium]|nr:pitrilysin family protein [Hyphomicrobiaceae bacterium]
MNATTTVTTLPNGLRVVTDRQAHLETVALGVWVAAGARHEAPAEHGISHLLEHMAFKGTKRRSARDIAEEIEAIGGELNAATSLETTAYYARVLKGDEGVALDILADILQHSAFDRDELERERDVILQEIAGYEDSPEDVVFDLVQEAAYPAQAIGRTILGTPESVAAVTPADLAGYLARHYAASRMVVGAVGAIEHDAFLASVEEHFASLSDRSRSTGEPAQFAAGAAASQKSFEQGHVVLGFEGLPYGHADAMAMQVMTGLYGGGMSSRLFQEVREKRGLCYSIDASAWGVSDTGMLTVHAATAPKQLDSLIAVIAEETRRLADEGPRDSEVKRAKAQLKAGLMMGLESPPARAEQMARHLLGLGRLMDKAEIIARVDAVTAADVHRLARKLVGVRPAAAIVGGGRASGRLAREAQERFAA